MQLLNQESAGPYKFASNLVSSKEFMSRKEPNIINILADDMSWGQLGWQGGGKHCKAPADPWQTLEEGTGFPKHETPQPETLNPSCSASLQATEL